MSDNDNNYPTVHTDKPVYDLGFDRGYSKARAEVIAEIRKGMVELKEWHGGMESRVDYYEVLDLLTKLERGASND